MEHLRVDGPTYSTVGADLRGTLAPSADRRVALALANDPKSVADEPDC
jgi:hypothetical protein